MGLSSRKKSGKKFGGSKLIVDGQGIYTTKTFPINFEKKRKKHSDFPEAPIPTTTTTTTTPIETCNVITQDDNVIITQDDFNIVLC